MTKDPASKRQATIEQMATQPRHDLQPQTYRDEDLQRIADAINVPPDRVLAERGKLEGAATFFRLDAREPQRTPPFKRKKKLAAVVKAANRLMKALHISSSDAAADGPGDQDIAEWLVEEAGDERRVLAATDAVGDIAAWASAAADREMPPEYTPPKTFKGDVAVNDWLRAVFPVYRNLTNKEPKTSTNPGTGEHLGPTIRFLIAATDPPIVTAWFEWRKISRSPAAWRNRVRMVKLLQDSD
ncbi:MAG: hypothetical protein V3R17_02155 [Hyphomicrobium sp.]